MSIYDGDDDDVVDDDDSAESDGAGDLDDTDVGEVIMADRDYEAVAVAMITCHCVL